MEMGARTLVLVAKLMSQKSVLAISVSYSNYILLPITVCFLLERSLGSVGCSRQDSLSSVEEDDYDTLADIDSDKNIVRTKVC